eukprot:Protomagalhaensia_wolfi_Nauph_80__3627@NODE_3663_length_741_cov_39_662393_g2884_i0_p1_GENE_NODE_3663_length_741_cov_39_662393_g2884_i0NODE_3663_length_741_cov_39_662393_g2884_i0_p1_ORF_typecomplete_len126_score14_65DUF778/PF05608_12/5e07TMEM219/PF14940_6/0_24_NODE_3663_length_741_cov_39_662393_g2884_i0286663
MEIEPLPRSHTQTSTATSPSCVYVTVSPHIVPRKNLYPFCVVWKPLPLITAICPIVGHTGIVDENGAIFDYINWKLFCGSKRRPPFGWVVLYWRLELSEEEAALCNRLIHEKLEIFDQTPFSWSN